MGIQDEFFGGNRPLMKSVELTTIKIADSKKKKASGNVDNGKPDRAADALAKGAFRNISENMELNRKTYGERARAEAKIKQKLNAARENMIS